MPQVGFGLRPSHSLATIYTYKYIRVYAHSRHRTRMPCVQIGWHTGRVRGGQSRKRLDAGSLGCPDREGSPPRFAGVPR
jgi:hypothetical protein